MNLNNASDCYMEDCYNNRELKYFDRNPGTYEVHNLGEIVSLFNPTRGNDFTNRIGRSSVIKSIYIRGSIKLGPFSTAVPPIPKVYIPHSLNRMIIFIDWQGKGTAPDVDDVLWTVDPEGHLNPNNRRRFTIIRDEQWAFSACLLYNASNEFQMEKTIIPIKIYERVDIPVYYTNTDAGNYTDIESGGLYMLLIGSNGQSIVQPLVLLDVGIRIRFEDGCN